LVALSKKNILVTGANGQLGMEFRDLEWRFPSHIFLFVSKDELAINNVDSVKQYFEDRKIHYCINCAAYTAVDKAESERELALAINATAVGTLAAVCKKHGTQLFHFSTDYVFNGQSDIPYRETDVTDPVNFYGQTKLEGEHAATLNDPTSIIIRTSWVYSRHGKNFVKTMMRLLNEKEHISVVADQVGSPTYAADLAAAVMQIIISENFIPGIYHYSNEGIISWYQFASAIKEIIGSNCVVNAIQTTNYPTPAARPKYSAFNTFRIRQTYALELKDWRKSLETCIAAMK
jgi:dTDP-4-dehydrorhamnose reductase